MQSGYISCQGMADVESGVTAGDELDTMSMAIKVNWDLTKFLK